MSKDLDINNYDYDDLLKLFKLTKLQGCKEQTDKIIKKVEKVHKQEYQAFYKKAQKILNVLEKLYDNETDSLKLNDYIPKITSIQNFPLYSDNDLIDLITQRALKSYNENLNRYSLLNDTNFNVHKFTPGYDKHNNTNKVKDGYPNPVAPGVLNPVKRITLNQNINLNSCFRHNYYQSDPADFIYMFPSEIKNVLSMRLVSIELPNSWYLISEKYKNNYFYLTIEEEDKTHQFEIVVPEGNYDSESLSYFLNNTYFYLSDKDTLLKFIEFSIDPFNNKTCFKLLDTSNKLSFSLQFIDNLQQNIMYSLGWLLGFRLANYNLIEDNLISEGLFDAGGDRYVYVCIDDFQYNNNSLNSVFFDKGLLNEEVIAKIPMTNGKLSLIVKEDSNPLSKIRKYTGPINIAKINIKLLDKFGNLINLNNMDYSLTLELELLYESFNFKNVVP